MNIEYPFAHQDLEPRILHGRTVEDPYRWLENADSEETRKWSAAQRDLCDRALGRLPGRAKLRARITELMGAGTISAPVWRGERQFFTRRRPDQERAVLLTVDATGQERVLLDPLRLDPTGSTTLDSWQPDMEGRRLAYKTSRGGTEESSLQVMDVATGELLEGPFPRVRHSAIAWLPGGRAYYYVRQLPVGDGPVTETGPGRRVYLHRVGTDPDADDVLIFGEDLPDTYDYGMLVSPDGRWLSLGASQGTENRSDLWVGDLTEGSPEAPVFRAVQVGVDADSGIYMWRDGRAYIFTDRDAPRSRLCVAPFSDLSYGAWRDLVPEDPEAVLTDFAILDGPGVDRSVLLVCWTRHSANEVTVHDLETGGRIGEVPTPGVGTLGGLFERPEGGHEAWFSYADSTSPGVILRYDARLGTTDTWADAPGAVDLPAVQSSQVGYCSGDGTTVHMRVIEPLHRTGPSPTILFGYGGFGASMVPEYDPSVLAWVEAGGVYAVAGLRGGGEEGEEWHRAGMRENKQRVFDDFHAAAEALIDGGWTTSAQLGIHGGSNGGLLVGAALTQRPELYRAVVCEAPLLDMVRYELFGQGRLWSAEYGSAQFPEELGWLLDYSPYHHVREGTAYPAVLFTVSENDARVDPMHARKMCAALQRATSSEAPVLLRSESDVGHKGRSLSRVAGLAGDTLAFLARHTGLDLP
ncbi:prolyl oligopeptidase family serine peptidase [Streptomyces resistomycificus]|uniref:Peptidase S9 n=1 Tax=Streptomyces resistomycificus TaxID=67356 RepID=A0A0L8LFM1_9ACTN|nr:prolyl oligopeptidase family serine peptidase [Streptomyces resistomycificus]KOG37048.1 peptidase S9 [Streptomyces resistomycificus]KUN94995.1 peptidase S9 [Streptomyces resistomycificus]